MCLHLYVNRICPLHVCTYVCTRVDATGPSILHVHVHVHVHTQACARVHGNTRVHTRIHTHVYARANTQDDLIIPHSLPFVSLIDTEARGGGHTHV